MKELNKRDTIEYIKHAVDMESSIITQEQIIKGFRTSCANNMPSPPQLKVMPQRQIALANQSSTQMKKTSIFYKMGIIFILPGVLLFFWWSNYVVVYLSFILILIGILLFSIGKRIRAKDIIQVEKEAQDEQHGYDLIYENETKAVSEENYRRKESYDRKLSEWAKASDLGLNYLNNRKEEIQRDLEEYYSVNAIFQKYRNLPALTSICEYLESGRCNELTGPNGAYNLYESELRQNAIIYQLDQLISNLESIRQNQYYLYEEVSKIKSNSDRIVNELSSIHGYVASLTDIAALNTYYNGVTASCSTAMTFYRSIL